MKNIKEIDSNGNIYEDTTCFQKTHDHHLCECFECGVVKCSCECDEWIFDNGNALCEDCQTGGDYSL